MIKLSTKANTLKSIEGLLQNAIVLPQVSFCVSEWEKREQEIIGKAIDAFKSQNVIVRSSAVDEDTASTSNAGKNLSIPDVRKDVESLKNAIDKVIASYEVTNPNNQVLIQPMLENVVMCGVAFTMDPSTLGDYYVISYDTSGATDAITSGESKEKLLYIYKNFPKQTEKNIDEKVVKLCNTLSELEKIFDIHNLDVEFAFDKEGQLYILQVRPLILVDKDKESISTIQIETVLKDIYNKIGSNQKKKPFLCGDSAVYSVMTDWNPAEMIGIRPKPLALSLYRELITDNIWAYQRDNYGYRNLRSFPLLVDFGGLPYIDVRVSFNSFIPATLDEALSEKLVNYYLQRLRDNPLAHDKAEFDIVFSCYTFDLDERIKVLTNYDFSGDEIKDIVDALRKVTNSITNFDNGLWRKDWEKIKILEKRYDEIANSDLSDIDKVYWLIEDCKRYGTLPFAGLARGAFIAVQMLKSSVSCGILSEDDYHLFMNSLNTISSQMKLDYQSLSKQGFLGKYGHLRPGTYDICSLRYDEKPELYFDWSVGAVSNSENEKKEFKLSLDQMKLFKSSLEKCGLSNDVLGLIEFIKSVIEERELSKFIFTKHISEILKLIQNIGVEYGLTADDMSYTSIQSFLRMYSTTEDPKEVINGSIECGKRKAAITSKLTLPPVIASQEDVYAFEYPDTEPNYITSGEVTAEVLEITGDSISESASRDISEKIVLIKSADPGYDWIFSHKIAGFITQYGGANSHMAIRAGELSIPAAVGVGEKLFSKVRHSKVVEINAREKTIKILRRK